MKDAYNFSVVALLLAILAIQLYTLLKKKENMVQVDDGDYVLGMTM